MRNHSVISGLLKRDTDAGSTYPLDARNPLTADALVQAALSEKVTMTIDAVRAEEAYRYVQTLAADRRAVYGLTTSFGGNIHNIVPPEEAELLQHNLILSHATNGGEFFPFEMSKAAFILRTATLGKGYSGVAPKTLELAMQMIERNIIPAVRIHGSVGASGDIGPLAALALTMMGEGKAWLPDGKTIVPSADALRMHGLSPITFSYKEGLALLNGTSMMTSVGAFTERYLRRLTENALVVTAMSIEALRASKQPFDARLHALKPHRYQINTANVLVSILEQSRLARSHADFARPIEADLQHAETTFHSRIDLQGGSYSVRGIPQAYGPILGVIEQFRNALDTEINAIDDNPIVVPEEDTVLHGANFHGHPIAVPSDCVNVAIPSIANLSIARIDRLLKPHHSHLPAFLATGRGGLYLGMHGIQFRAAGDAKDIQNLASPTSASQIPTNNDNQDFVSFGLQSTVKGMEMTMLLAYVIAVEYMCAAQGIWLNCRGKSLVGPVTEGDLSPVTHTAYDALLSLYEPRENKDQCMIEQIESVAQYVMLNDLLPDELREKLWK